VTVLPRLGSPAIDQLRDEIVEAGSPEACERLVMAFMTRHSLPVSEGDLRTFVVRAEADQAYLRHRMVIWPQDLPMTRLAGTDLWYLSIEVAPGSRVEYHFDVREGTRWRGFNDPSNPDLARSPVGDASVCYGAGYRAPHWARYDSTVSPGDLVEIKLRSRVQSRENRVTLYLPPGFALTARYPLLVVHDGGDYLGYASMKEVLDNLIAAGELAPVVVAFTHPGERLTEYPDDPRHAAWITRELVPELETRYPLEARASGRCLMGTSFGAVASLATAVRYPQAFSALLLQSGSFVYSDPAVNHGEGPSFIPVIAFMDSYRSDPVRVADRCFIACGAYEDLIDANRGMLPAFQQTGMEINYIESLAGHSWDAWRDQLRDGLCWIFPGDRP